jgi:hypothetical protein
MKTLALVLTWSLVCVAAERTDAQRANDAVVAYLSAWNEREPRKRHDAVARAWAANGTSLDAHRKAAGLDELDAMIAAAQARFPGYTLHLVTSVEAHRVQRYLECRQLRCGFVEVRCEGCHEVEVVAFSRKGRGLCSSRTTRRSVETTSARFRGSSSSTSLERASLTDALR